VEIATPNLRGRVGDTLPDPVLVRVTDSLGRALADLPVAWSPVEDGAFTAHTTRTDSLGEARATWKLGAKAGRQHARVQVGNARTMPPARLAAVAEPGPAAAVRPVSGDRQTGSVGQPLPQSIVLRATDLHGNPVAGAVLRLLPAAGRSAESELSTDSTGRAKVVWTLGRTAGLQRLTARLQGDTAETEITAVARAGKAVKIAFVSPPESGKPGRALPKPLVVQVTDSYGNPIAGQTVVFKAGSGSATPTRGLSDAEGRTSVRWTLGPKAQRPELVAKVSGTVVSSTLTLNRKP
jgi:adhesin/invasin